MEKVKDFAKQNYVKILFVLILIIAIFSRGYKLTSIPEGLHRDEAAMAYDAFSLATEHTDRYLNHFPVYLINFGGGQSALYAYLTALFITIFGFNFFSIRFTAFLLGVLAVIAVYFLVKNEKGEKFALAFMALLTICPWHIMASRFGLDCNLFAPMIIFSILFLVNAKSYKGYIISGVLFGLTLYTYALSYVIVPIFLFLTLIYMLYTKKISIKNIIILGIPIFILALPLMLMILINNGYLNEINSFITINKLPGYRGTEIGLSFIKNNSNFINTMFNEDGLPYNALKEFGTIYKFSVFLAIFGFCIEINSLIMNIKNRKFEIGTVLFLLFVCVLFCMLIIIGPNINKANALYIPLVYFIVVTMEKVYKDYKIFFGLMVILFVIYFIRFEYFYFAKYPKNYINQPYFESQYMDDIKYINSKENLKSKDVHVISAIIDRLYVYTLVSDLISPKEFNETVHENNDNELFSYGKYYFEDYKIDEDAIYIVKFNDEFVNQLLSAGFKVDDFDKSGIFRILYK